MLTPALAERPVRIGEIDACSESPLADFARSGDFTPYTANFNVTGQPAISLPLYQDTDGLPLAVQLGRPPRGRGHSALTRRAARGRAPLGRAPALAARPLSSPLPRRRTSSRSRS